MPIYLLSTELVFPPPELAEPEGLLAVGGDLSIDRLLLAYKMGIFPWYSEGEPILWWSPDPRMVLFPSEIHIPRRLQRILRQGRFKITFDKAFSRVIEECAAVRQEKGQGTWITQDMMQAYTNLHLAGYAHSAEAWYRNKLVGGVYGVALGQVFFGESMFSRVSNSSKAAFVTLVENLRHWGFRLIDCQVSTQHLARFGAREIPRKHFLEILRDLSDKPSNAPAPHWTTNIKNLTR